MEFVVEDCVAGNGGNGLDPQELPFNRDDCDDLSPLTDSDPEPHLPPLSGISQDDTGSPGQHSLSVSPRASNYHPSEPGNIKVAIPRGSPPYASR
jgi:hypothetical protein